MLVKAFPFPLELVRTSACLNSGHNQSLQRSSIDGQFQYFSRAQLDWLVDSARWAHLLLPHGGWSVQPNRHAYDCRTAWSIQPNRHTYDCRTGWSVQPNGHAYDFCTGWSVQPDGYAYNCRTGWSVQPDGYAY